MKIIFDILPVALILLISTGISAIEMPEYTVEKKDGEFELRKYPTMVAAATASGNRNSGFGKLFKFISGNNDAEKKIAMTSPVFMPANSEGQTREMMFLVPKDVVSSGVPEPKSEEVSIKTMEAGKFAVIRSAGRMDSELRRSLLEKLESKVVEHNLETVGEPMFAGYDPPWTPGPKRRNEILVRVK